jgi:hypothetical protein
MPKRIDSIITTSIKTLKTVSNLDTSTIDFFT